MKAWLRETVARCTSRTGSTNFHKEREVPPARDQQPLDENEHWRVVDKQAKRMKKAGRPGNPTCVSTGDWALCGRGFDQAAVRFRPHSWTGRKWERRLQS